MVRRAVFLYIATYVENSLFCRMSGILQDFYGEPLIGGLAGRWPLAWPGRSGQVLAWLVSVVMVSACGGSARC